MAPQVYLVTGANKDIGYEVVRILSERLGDQAIILLGTRSLDNGKAAIAKMQQANRSFNYTNVYPLEIDVTKSESIQAAAEFVKATYGTLHALINNAGITAYVEGVDACFNVNVFGVHETLSAFHSIMVPSQSINIVVASEVGAWTFSTLSRELQAIFANYSAIDIPTLRELADGWKCNGRY
ncbi:putative short-chain dehydrogenase/reductase [Aphanomyces cochlioides]|nr:putative short-chain dehydrogenase/reductase [Aphanomyces cochlioides]